MKHMKTTVRVLALILCIAMVLPGAVLADDTGNEVRAAKKIISVVYDDSSSTLYDMYGSENGECWVYINYAIQALTALLNTSDELYITFMSSPEKAVKMDLSDIEGTVGKIRQHNQTGATPLKALDTAQETLEGISEKDPSTQYWLLVLTDGQITSSNIWVDVQGWMNHAKNKKMANNTGLNVAYLAMGSAAQPISGDEKNGLYAYEAKDNAAIAKVMAEIANLISSRLPADNIVAVDERTIRFSSKLPLYSISVLSQNSVAYVTEAKTAEAELYISRNIGLDASYAHYPVHLTGNAAVIHSRSGDSNVVIPAGEYFITFSEPVDPADLNVQYEPAIAMMVEITRDGIVIDDFSDLVAGDRVDISVKPVIPGTFDEIDEADLPAGLSWKIEYEVDKKVEDESAGQSLGRVVQKHGDNVIRCTMSIPGFAPLIDEREYKITVIVYNFGIQTEQPSPLVYYRSTIKDGSKDGSVVFRITNDGVPMTKEQLKKAKATLKIGNVSCADSGEYSAFSETFGKWLAKCSLEQNDDGSFVLKPALPLPFSAFFVKVGDYTADVYVSADETVTAAGTFHLAPHSDDTGSIIKFVLFLLAVLYILHLILKKHFHGHSLKQTTYTFDRYRNKACDTGVFARKLTPLSGIFALSTACTVSYNGLRVRANGPDSVIIVGKSVAASCVGYGTSTEDPERRFNSIARDLKSTKDRDGKRKVVPDIELSTRGNKKLYLKTSDDADSLVCIWLE